MVLTPGNGGGSSARYILVPGNKYRLYVMCSSNKEVDVTFRIYWKYKVSTYQYRTYKSYSFDAILKPGDNEVEVENDPFLDIIAKDADRTLYGKTFSLVVEVYDYGGNYLDGKTFSDFAYVAGEKLSVDIEDAVIRV